MAELWIVGAICAFLLTFYLVVSCGRYNNYPRYYDYVFGIVAGLCLSFLSWVAVIFLLMILSIPRND